MNRSIAERANLITLYPCTTDAPHLPGQFCEAWRVNMPNRRGQPAKPTLVQREEVTQLCIIRTTLAWRDH
jgi:hypothetical protein